MAATITVREALRRVSNLLNDMSPQFQRFPEALLVDWLNDAHLAVAKYLPASCSRVDAVKLKPGTRQSIESIAAADCKPGDGSTPTAPVLGTQLLDVICNMGADGLTAGKSVRVVDREILDVTDPLWHARTSTAGISSFMHDPRTPMYFLVTPGVPASGSYWAMVALTAQPARIPNTGAPGSELYAATGGNSLAIGLRDEFIDDIVNYTVARANMADLEWADGNKASNFIGLFLNSINSKVAAITGNNPNLSRLPFAPEPIGAAK